MAFIHFSSFANTDLFEPEVPKVGPFQFRSYALHMLPCANFDADDDAQKLEEALEGSGTNEQCIIDIVTSRSNAQRKEILVSYKILYERDLIEDLYNKLSGKFRDVIIGLMTPLKEYLCKELNKSLSGLSTDEDALVEILCTKTNKEMAELIVAYDDLYNRPLVEHLCSSTGGYFRRLLIMIVSGSRDQSDIVNPILVQKHVAALDNTLDREEKSKIVRHNEEVFNRILSHDNFAMLRKVFEEYKNVTGKTIEEAVVHEISGELKDAMLAIIESVQSTPAFFAKRLFRAMDGFITRDSTLIGILVCRSEVDLGLIKSEFEKLYDQTLLSVVKNKTTGDYKHVLCRLIGGT